MPELHALETVPLELLEINGEIQDPYEHAPFFANGTGAVCPFRRSAMYACS
jgi:hypothetical protein